MNCISCRTGSEFTARWGEKGLQRVYELADAMMAERANARGGTE